MKFKTGKIKVKEQMFKRKFNTIEDIMDALGSQINDLTGSAQEQLAVISLDAGAHIIDLNLVAVGSINHIEVYVKEVMWHLLDDRAHGFIAIHNHPGGNIDPSKEDLIAITKLKKASRTMDIKMIDFIIIGPHGKWISVMDG